jgi:hypothetical protein
LGFQFGRDLAGKIQRGEIPRRKRRMKKPKKISEKFVEKISSVLAVRPAEGQALLRAALEELQQANHSKVVKTVSILLERVRSMERVQKQAELRLALTRAQLKAINDGKFRILPDLNPPDNIEYHEENLNISWDSTAKWGMTQS